MAIEKHNHNGIDSNKIKVYYIIPTFTMTSTQLSKYLARPAIEGERFTNYDGTNYREYIRINKLWKYITLS